MADVDHAGPKQNFPTALQAIHFAIGRWLVIEIHKLSTNCTPVIKPVASSFSDFTPTKKMPFVEGEKRNKLPPGLSVTKDKLLHSLEWRDDKNNVTVPGDAQPGYTTETRDLIFINLSLIQSKTKPSERRITFDLKLEGIKAEDEVGSGDRKFAYWFWETEFLSSSNGNLGIGPAPSTLEEALSTKTFTMYYGAVFTIPWISFENNADTNTALHNANRRSAQVGVAPAPDQDADGYGWRTEAEQMAAINYLNAWLVWNEQFTHDSNHQTYFPVTFPLTTKGPKTTRKVEYKITAGYYAGRLNFPYDDKSSPTFPKASEDTTADDKAQRYAEYSITKTQPENDSTIRVVLDNKNHVTISQES